MRSSIFEVKQYLACCVASLSYLAISATYSWINPVLPDLLNGRAGMATSEMQAVWMASLPELSSVLAAIPAGLLADMAGRKAVLLATAPISIAIQLMIYFLPYAEVLLFARFLQGLILGVGGAVLPTYLGEIADPKIRGILATLCTGYWGLGGIYGYLSGSYVSYENSILLITVPFMMFGILFPWFPESPYYLINRGDIKGAKNALARLREGEVEEEFSKMLQSEEQEKGSLKELFQSRKARRALLIVSVVSGVTFMGGYMSVLAYSSEVTEAECRDPTLSKAITSALGFIILTTNAMAIAVVDKQGRRILLLVCFGMNALVLSPALVFYLLELSLGVSLRRHCLIPVLSTMACPLVLSFGTSTVIRLYQVELFTTRFRSIASGITTVLVGLTSGIGLVIFQLIFYTDDFRFINYLIFIIFSLIGFAFVLFYVPETKGKTFHEIQDLL